MFPFFPVSCPSSLLCFHSQFFCFVCYCSSTCSKLCGALWQWSRKRKESLQLCLWNLNICIEKSQCKRLIGRDDISNDVITLGMCFQCLFHSCSFLLLAYLQNLTAQSTGSHGGIGGGIQITETSLQALLPSFPTGYGDHAAKNNWDDVCLVEPIVITYLSCGQLQGHFFSCG